MKKQRNLSVKEVAEEIYERLEEAGSPMGYRKIERQIRKQWNSSADESAPIHSDPTFQAVYRKIMSERDQ